MRYGKLAVVAACGALFVVGCEKKKAAPAGESGTTMEHLQKSAEKSADSAKEMVKSGTDKMSDMATSAKENVSKAAESASSAVANSDMAKTAASELAQVKQYIADHKYDLADKALGELESHKASLPEAIASQLPAVRQQLDALKAK